VQYVGDISNYQRMAWQRSGWDYTQGINGTDENGSIKITRADVDKDLHYWTEEMPADEQASVATYGGFYIGRYETGVKDYTNKIIGFGSITDETEKQNWTGYTGENTKVVIQKDQEVWNYITRGRAITEANLLYNKADDNVISKLCSSYAWDSTLKFIQEQSNTYAINSVGGNFKVTSDGSGVLQLTGYYSVNNIYDMGGTLENGQRKIVVLQMNHVVEEVEIIIAFQISLQQQVAEILLK